MEPFMTANGVVSFVTAAALTAVILSPRVSEGVLIKLGLVVVAFSLYVSGLVSLFSDDPTYGLVNSAFTLRVGLLIVCVGAALRTWRPVRSHRPRRRLSDILRPGGRF